MSKFIDLTGQRFGMLTVIDRGPNKGRLTAWNCICDCGKTSLVTSTHLRTEHTKSCGCQKGRKKNIEDLTGQTKNELTIIKRIENNKKGQTMWEAQCSCGNTTTISGIDFRIEKKKSCGCLKTKKTAEDLTGQRFGRIFIESYSHYNEYHFYNCECDCGNKKVIRGDSLKGGKTTSCGCIQKEAATKVGKEKAISIEYGTRFGKLVALDRDFNHGRSKKSAYYNVQCDCGNKNVVLGRHLRQGTTISCGCINSKGEEEIAKILFENKIEFKKQYSFKNLKSKKNRLLKFDFAVFKDGKLSHLIEFDGEQHSDKTSRYYSETMVQNDNIKNKYCADNNIRLIRLTKDDSLTIDKLV